MAIIQKNKIKIGNTEILQVVKCSADGTFSIAYPEEVHSSLTTRVESGDVKDEVVRAWTKTCHRVLEATETTLKVIHFEFKANCKKSIRHDGDQYPSGYEWETLINRQDMTYSSALALGVSARVFIETEKKFPDGQSVYSYQTVNEDEQFEGNIRNASLGADSWQLRGKRYPDQLEWTQERHDFFQKFNDNLEDFIMMLDKALASPEVLLQAIESGQLLLGGPTE